MVTKSQEDAGVVGAAPVRGRWRFPRKRLLLLDSDEGLSAAGQGALPASASPEVTLLRRSSPPRPPAGRDGATAPPSGNGPGRGRGHGFSHHCRRRDRLRARSSGGCARVTSAPWAPRLCSRSPSPRTPPPAAAVLLLLLLHTEEEIELSLESGFYQKRGKERPRMAS